jgi:hypothetical protein
MLPIEQTNNSAAGVKTYRLRYLVSITPASGSAATVASRECYMKRYLCRRKPQITRQIGGKKHADTVLKERPRPPNWMTAACNQHLPSGMKPAFSSYIIQPSRSCRSFQLLK